MNGTGQKSTQFEYSAGGVVEEAGRLLMVKVENLEGRQVWTFPKGHIEPGEQAADAALREVEEETGYRCAIVRPYDRAQYWFKRDDVLTKKTVTWFLMKPLEKTGEHDPEEILETRWMSLGEAKELAKYKSDKQLLERLETEG